MTEPNVDTSPCWVPLLVETSLPLFLGPVGLAHLQLTASLPMSALMPGHIWHRCMSTDFPRLARNPSCFEMPYRRDLMRCYGPLRRSVLAEGDWPVIHNAEEAKRLAKLLFAMERDSRKHLGTGGRVAGVLVGRFHFEEWSDDDSDDDDVSPRGQANVFVLPKCLHTTIGGPTAELPICLGLDQNCLVLQVGQSQVSEMPRQTINAINEGLLLDVKAACAEGCLNYQQINLSPDGHACNSHAGMHFLPQYGRSSNQEQCIELLCALYIRDGELKNWRSDLVDTLHLEGWTFGRVGLV